MAIELVVAALVGTSAFMGSLLFLPAAIELRRPRDAGPRLISNDISLICIACVADMEAPQPNSRQLASMFTGCFSAIQNLEL
ncbi:MAG: hypothetical protein NWE93_12655 [Candidatus Bathyarchaeota archaeon]|nr:hypothetical protein [Candidatus Bathyarchaeota archaeon]